MSTRPQASRIPILLVNTPTLPPIGADTWIHVQVIRALDRSRFEPHVACMTGPPGAPTPLYAAVSTIPDIELLRVNFGREHRVRSGFGRFTEALGDLATIPSLMRLALHIRRQHIPIIHTVSRPRDALACVVLARVTGTKCLIHMQLAWGEWMSRSLRWSLRHADGLIAISDFVAETLVESGHRPERIYHAYNAVIFEDWNPSKDRASVRDELGLPASGPLVVSVSRLFAGKGTAELVRAIGLVRKEIPDVKLVVVGQDVTGGSFMKELQGIIEEEQLHENVIFVGQRPDVVRFMAAADIFAMPSFGEPFGIVFAEAMAMELPVVALNNGGTPEVVEHGRAGLLSDPGDIPTLAANLVTLLSDSELRTQMGTYGREQVRKRFTIEHLGDAVAAVYEAVAN
jgi:glycosyltransferase involved in cell wall biosynthesis